MSLVRHTSFNVLGAALPLVVQIATLPLYVSLVGLDRYGALSICLLLLGYLALFDFGLGKALTQRLAQQHEASAEDQSNTFWSAASLSLVLSAAPLLFFVPLTHLAFSIVSVEPGLRTEIEASLPLLAMAVPLGIVASLLGGALQGVSAFFLFNLSNLLATLLMVLLPLGAAYFVGPQLPVLTTAALLARGLSLIPLAWFVACKIPLRRPRITAPSEMKTLLRFGGWVTVANLVAPILVYGDRLIIGTKLGAEAVGIYVVSFNIIFQLVLVPAALSAALLPRMARERGSTNSDSGMAFDIMLLLVTPMCVITALALPPFMKLWLGGPHWASAAGVGCVLLLGVWINSFARLPATQLLAANRPRPVAMLLVLETPFYVGLMLLTLPIFGLLAAAAVCSLRCLVDAIGLFWIAEKRAHRLLVLTPHALILMFALWASFTLDNPILWRAITALVLSLVSLILAISQSPTLRQRLWDFSRQARALSKSF